MKCTIPEISWHNRDPVLSVDIQPNRANDAFCRLATGGTDSHVLIWLLSVEKSGVASLECAADLARHSKPVNCVRFSPSGELLASGDDESCIIIWKMKTGNEPAEFPCGEEENFKEQWISVKVLRGHLQDVYDLCWSADSKNLISGSVDNTAILWEVSSGKNLGILGDHKGFVQGVTWDPCGRYIATMSSDRVCRVYNASSRRVVSKMYKGHLPGVEAESKPRHFFHDDTLKSFFRRLTFTPDGELLIVPSGVVEESDKTPSNSTVIFARNCFNKVAMYLPSLSQYTVAVRCCPVLFTLRDMQAPPLFQLPYRVVIAVATQCSVVLYDTQHAAPFAFITKIHYTRLTDLSWSSDGRVLVVSSTDGYCSVVTFVENELGTVYKPEKNIEEQPENKQGENSVKDKLPEINIKANNEKNLQNQTVDVNMSLTSDQKNHAEKDFTRKFTSTLGEECNHTDQETISVSKSQETVMDLDDFQLEYEATVTEPVLESSELTEQDKTCESVKHTESPTKHSDTMRCLQQEAITSPRASGATTIQGNSSKKTPRRVQLITLSSPKSRKQLLQ